MTDERRVEVAAEALHDHHCPHGSECSVRHRHARTPRRMAEARTVAALYGWGQMICWDCTEADA